MLGVFLDTETNGLNPQVHRIVEIAFQIVNLKTGELYDTYQALIEQSPEHWSHSDPESLQVNGFTWDEVRQNGLPASYVKEQIIKHFHDHHIVRKKALFIGQNPSFDRIFFSQLVDPPTQEMLNWPYHWLDFASMFWALTMKQAQCKNGKSSIFPWSIGCSKDAIAKHHHIDPEEKPHRALNGVKHLLLCYRTVVGFPEENEKRDLGE